MMQLLRSHGLRKTAQSLARESGLKGLLEDDPPALATVRANELLTARFKEASEAQKLRLSETMDEMGGQRQRIAELLDTVKRLRGHADRHAGDEETLHGRQTELKAKQAQVKRLLEDRTRQVALEKALSSERDRSADELRVLRRDVEGLDRDNDAAKRKLLEVEQDRDRLVAELAARNDPDKDAKKQAARLKHLLDIWDGPKGGHRLCQTLFKELSGPHSAGLRWDNDDNWVLAQQLFERSDLWIPDWLVLSHAWYELSTEGNLAGNYIMDLHTTQKFAKYCFECQMRRLQHPNTWRKRERMDHKVGGAKAADHPLTVANVWVERHSNRLIAPLDQRVINYEGEMTVDIEEFHQFLGPFIQHFHSHGERMGAVMKAGDHLWAALEQYYRCDADHNGALQWNNGEIRNFVKSVFWQQGLRHPDETHMYNMYARFDSHRKYALTALDCVCMVDAFLRALFFHTHAPGYSYAAPQAAMRSPNAFADQVSPAQVSPVQAFAPHSGTFVPPHSGGRHSLSQTVVTEPLVIQGSAYGVSSPVPYTSPGYVPMMTGPPTFAFPVA